MKIFLKNMLFLLFTFDIEFKNCSGISNINVVYPDINTISKIKKLEEKKYHNQTESDEIVALFDSFNAQQKEDIINLCLGLDIPTYVGLKPRKYKLFRNAIQDSKDRMKDNKVANYEKKSCKKLIKIKNNEDIIKSYMKENILKTNSKRILKDRLTDPINKLGKYRKAEFYIIQEIDSMISYDKIMHDQIYNYACILLNSLKKLFSSNRRLFNTFPANFETIKFESFDQIPNRFAKEFQKIKEKNIDSINNLLNNAVNAIYCSNIRYWRHNDGKIDVEYFRSNNKGFILEDDSSYLKFLCPESSLICLYFGNNQKFTAYKFTFQFLIWNAIKIISKYSVDNFCLKSIIKEEMPYDFFLYQNYIRQLISQAIDNLDSKNTTTYNFKKIMLADAIILHFLKEQNKAYIQNYMKNISSVLYVICIIKHDKKTNYYIENILDNLFPFLMCYIHYYTEITYLSFYNQLGHYELKYILSCDRLIDNELLISNIKEIYKPRY